MDIISINNYNTLLDNLKTKYGLQPCTLIAGKNPDEVVSQFLINKLYEEFTVHDCYIIPDINNDNIYFGALAIGIKIYQAKSTIESTELHPFIIKELPAALEKMCIRPETFGDKFIDFFINSDIDFKDFPEFSSKYCFIAKNKEEAIRFANNNRLQIITNQDRISIEIDKNLLFAKFDRIITEQDGKSIIEFAKKI